MTTPLYTVACLKNRLLASDVYEIVLKKPANFTFTPGQFVLFQVPLLKNPKDVQPRAYSIASTPEEEELIFIIRLKSGGRSSIWIENILKAGMYVQFQGPFGLFLLDRTTPKDYLFICTGAGIGPFRSMILDHMKRPVLCHPEPKKAQHDTDSKRIDLIFGVRNEAELFWQEDLQELAQKHENFFIHLALSKASDQWKGHRGRVQTLVPLITKDFSNKNVYLCGNPDMTTEVKKLCLEEWGVRKEDLHVEGYM